MRIPMGQTMTQSIRSQSPVIAARGERACLAGALLIAPVIFSGAASAQMLGYASASQGSFPSDDVTVAPTGPR